MSVPRKFIVPLVLSAFMVSASIVAEPAQSDFRIQDGVLMNNGSAFRIKAFHVPHIGETGSAFSVRVSNLARIAEVGGNTIAFDLAGFNDDGTEISPEGVAVVDAFVERAIGSWMGVLVRVLGDSTDPDFRSNAVRTAATALKDYGRAAFLIDGPDAGALAAAFKEIAPDRLVIAPEGGDIPTADSSSVNEPESNVLLLGSVAPLAREKVHFMAPMTPENLRALDLAMVNPVEMLPWSPDNSILSDEERSEGFIALFNGKNLDGWWIKGGNPNAYKVTDEGVLEWAESGGNGLYTRDRYENFILRLDWKIEKDGNNGIWLRAPRDGRQSKIGMECQLLGDSEVESLDKSGTCSVYDVLPPMKNAANPEGEWNSMEIMFEGSHYRCTLNGELVQDVDFNDHEELKYRLRKGFIVITDHGDYAAFRNIRLKRL